MISRWPLWMLLGGAIPSLAGEMPEKAAGFHEALSRRPESAVLFQRFRAAWLETRTEQELEDELKSRAEAGEPGAWAILGRARVASGESEQALEAFAKALEAGPGAAWLRLERARLWIAGGQFENAEKEASAVPDDAPEKTEAAKLAGLACLKSGRADAASAHWQAAEARSPRDGDLLEDLTELTRREGRLDLALDYARKWQEAESDPYQKAEAILRTADLLLGLRRNDEALARVGEVLGMSGDGSWLEREALAKAERHFEGMGDAVGWEAWMGTRTAEYPMRAGLRRAQARALAQAGKPDQALEALGELLKRLPGDREALLLRVDFLESAGRVAAAYDECSVIEEGDDPEGIALKLAHLAFALDRPDAVKQALDRPLRGATPAARVAWAPHYAKFGLPRVAEELLRSEGQGVAAGAALRGLAGQFESEGRIADAREAWKQLGARADAGDRIEAARRLVELGDMGTADAVLEKDAERFSKEPAYRLARADLASTLGRRRDAMQLYLALAEEARRLEDLQAAMAGWLAAAKGSLPDQIGQLPDNAAGRCLKAGALAALGRTLPDLPGNDPLEREARLALLRQHGMWTEMVSLLESAPDPRGRQFFRDLTEARSRAGDLAGALQSARSWRERIPDDAAAWVCEADLLAATRDSAGALSLIARAEAKFVDDLTALRSIFQPLKQAGDADAALAFAWRMHDREESGEARGRWMDDIIAMSTERGRTKELQDLLQKRAETSPSSFEFHLALAKISRLRPGREALDEERAHLEAARQRAPENLKILKALVDAHTRAGNKQKAVACLDIIARRSPPTPDAAWENAIARLQAKDFTGAARDFRALALRPGLDPRWIERIVLLIDRDYSRHDAIEILDSMDPVRLDARLLFIHGMLLESVLGREQQAFESYVRFMKLVHGRKLEPSIVQLVSGFHSNIGRLPSPIDGLRLPSGLHQATSIVAMRILRMRLQSHVPSWEEACGQLPGLTVAAEDDWRQAIEFSRIAVEKFGTPDWWAFAGEHPANPLGPLLLHRSGELAFAKPTQVRQLLERNPPLVPGLELAIRRSHPQGDTLEWLIRLDRGAWRDEAFADSAIAFVNGLLENAEKSNPSKDKTKEDASRAVGTLEESGLTGRRALAVHFMKARIALLNDDPDGFLEHLSHAMDAHDERQPGSLETVPDAIYGYWRLGLGRWRRAKGDAAFNELLGKVPSPALRCLFVMAGPWDKSIASLRSEFDSLPADAPRPLRRDLIRLRWDMEGIGAGREKMMGEWRALSVDDADPRLALEALFACSPLMKAGMIPPSPRMTDLLEELQRGGEADRRFSDPYVRDVSLRDAWPAGPKIPEIKP